MSQKPEGLLKISGGAPALMLVLLSGLAARAVPAMRY
jgi:hypothetical protein